MPNTVCVECNSEVPDSSGFCPECGYPAEAGKVSCPECLNPVSLSLEACPECGFPLDGLKSAQEAGEEEPPPPLEEAAPEPLPDPEPAAAAAQAPQERIVLKRIEPGEELSDRVQQAQVDALNELTVAVGRLLDGGSGGGLGDVAQRVETVLTSAEASKNEMLSDLIESINRFVESSEKIKNDMLTDLKEQSLIAVSSMKELADSVSGDAKAAAEAMKEAQKSASAEMNGILQQIKTAAVKEPEQPKSDAGDYLLYICGLVLLFVSLNIIVTAYVVKLVKQ